MPLPYTTSATIAWGSFVFQPTTGNANTNVFIAEDFEVTEPSFVGSRLDQNGAPNGAFMVAEARTGRGTLQIANTATVIPERGDEFSHAVRVGQANVTFFLTELTLTKRNRDFNSFAITFREKI